MYINHDVREILNTKTFDIDICTRTSKYVRTRTPNIKKMVYFNLMINLRLILDERLICHRETVN